MFLQAQAGYAARTLESTQAGYAARTLESTPHETETGGQKTQARRSSRLMVRPWHRGQMQKMVCKAVFFHFLQDLRTVFGLRSEQPPLCSWEAEASWKHLHRGEVVQLIKYLAETELHIAEGTERCTMEPGARVGGEELLRVRAERRQLVKQWNVGRRNLKEDEVLRIFLDGRLCWSSVRDLLTNSPLLQKHPVTAPNSMSSAASADTESGGV
jgi:hypothetical protein